MIRLIAIMAMVLVLGACEGGRSFSFTRPYALDASPPPGSETFRKAYVDGCESALSGMGNQFIKLFHDFKYDASLTKDKLYNRTWDAANNYCRLFLFVGDEQLLNEDFKQYNNKPIFFWE